MTRVSAVGDDALGTLDTVGLLAELRARRVSPDELRAAARARADRVRASLNAEVMPVNHEGDAAGAFAGIPSVLKDNEDLAGHATRYGSLAVPDRPALASSRFATQLGQLGLSFVGKSTLPEFGLTATTESDATGATRNPWNTGHSTGGSSGGAAALVAAGVIPIAHANDGGGSTRIPASCCGLVGLKPSRGRLIDVEEMDRMPVNVVTQGVVSRTVRDTALFYSEIEKLHRSPDLPPLGHIRGPDGQRLRIAVLSTGMRGIPVDPATRGAVMTTAGLLAEMGHRVEEIDQPFDERIGPDFLRYWGLLSLSLRLGGRSLFGSEFRPDQLGLFARGLARYARVMLERIPGSISRMRGFERQYEQAFRDRGFDVLLSPVLAHEPPRIGYLGPQVPFREHMVRLLRYASFTAIQNISGTPAISLPMGRGPNGVPIGIQLAAAFGREDQLLSLAYELEDARPWPTQIPG